MRRWGGADRAVDRPLRHMVRAGGGLGAREGVPQPAVVDFCELRDGGELAVAGWLERHHGSALGAEQRPWRSPHCGGITRPREGCPFCGHLLGERLLVWVQRGGRESGE